MGELTKAFGMVFTAENIADVITGIGIGIGVPLLIFGSIMLCVRLVAWMLPRAE